MISPTPLGAAQNLPRLVVAAPGSGHGKTTIATGLMGALAATGRKVAGFKVGPDYIDPGYHTLATGRPGRNLDPYLCGEEQMAPLLLHGARTPDSADIAIIEGVMGLFDGQIGSEGFASTAHVASLVQAPVIMVIDISHTSRTAAAMVHGLNTFDPRVRLSGVIINKSGSERHAREIVGSIQATGLEVLGILPRDAGIEIPSRHLGLVPAAEREEAADAIKQLSRRISDHVSLSSIISVAQSAPMLEAEPWSPTDKVRPPSDARPVVAIAAGRAFTFRYAETDELLRAAGCEPVVFDPTSDEQLPAGTAGLYLGGGFPEVHAAELAANEPLLSSIRAAVNAGMPTVGECAGLLYLCRSVDGLAMVSALDANAIMTDRLTLRYRTVAADHDQLLAGSGTSVTGHEFHRTAVEPSHGGAAAWLVDGEPAGFSTDPAGSGRESVHASYLHIHWAGYPDLAQRFANAVHDHAKTMRPEPSIMCPEPVEGRIQPTTTYDLHYHGDRDVAEGLVDLAVNVRLSAPPDWLGAIINDTTRHLASYPNTDAAAKAIAEAHGVTVDQVLPTAGGAEAFTLLSRAIRPRSPLIIHPQFTEPEAALIAAGHRPQRVVLSPADGFRLHVARVAEDADLVVIGNPTNPTSVLHPAALINSLRRPGRVVVVDEAFMDAVPGEVESVISDDLTGLLVLRSLTKTWGVAGLRAGYVLGEPKLIAAMRRQQPPWSVSTPALAAIVACVTPGARNIAAAAAEEIASRRAYLVEQLADVGLTVAGLPRGPFVLVDTSAVSRDREPGWVRLSLRDHGLAVRRGETFPGLGPEWIRIAVREPGITDQLVAALRRLVRL
ncbi:MAG TPA: cobyrinate a,c-diamide synthase [Propionibacteriaceae bacterium]|nr:cobyrinate a,c-diamide synthase [Propionibacteriaceae bacterium]